MDSESLFGNPIVDEEEQPSEEDEVEEPTATPLWKYVTKVTNEATGSKGKRKFTCNFGCRTDPYSGSYSRVRQHLIGTLPGHKKQGISVCPSLTKSDREMLKQEELNAQRLFEGNSKMRKLPSRPQGYSPSTMPLNAAASIKGTVDRFFHVAQRDEVDQKIARCLYGNGVPFNIVRSPLWADMVSAINSAPQGYKSPNYEKVRTTLLDKEQSKVKQALNGLTEDWNTHGVSIISDGWSNVKNVPLINIMAASGGSAMFVNAHDVASIEKNAQNIADLLIKAIEQVGQSIVVQVVTDNAPNCKAAGALIELKYPHIFWSGCLAHTLNLLMKDIAKCEHPSLSFVSDTYKRGKAVVKYIKNHSSCQHLFGLYSALELLRVKKTRFGHHYIVMQHLVQVRGSLLAMALSREWESLRKSPNIEQHDIVHETLMDHQFWRNATKVLKITKPIYRMIRFSDSDKAVVGEVYEQMDTMLGIIKDILVNDSVLHELISNLVVARWDKMNIPLHCLAYVLVPKYYTNSWLAKPAPGGVTRKKPHFDQEVQRGYLEAVDKMIHDPTEAALIRCQISDFVSNKGVFAHPQAVMDRSSMSALSWWHMYGGVAPELYSLSMKVLSQNVNPSCAERCWSTYSYIHSVKRNRLNADRAEKLVFVHYNQRLLTRLREDYEGTYKNWDTNPEADNIEEDIETIEAREATSLSDGEDDYSHGNAIIPTPTSPISPQVRRPSAAASSISTPTSCPPPSTSSPSTSSRPPPSTSKMSVVEKARKSLRAKKQQKK